MIYLDMDGVLVDFDKGLLDNYGVTNDLVCYGTPDKDKTPEQWELSKKVWGCMNTPGFFKYLPPMVGYSVLYDSAKKLTHDVFILTAFPTHGGETNEQVKKDKWDWLQQNIPEVTQDKFIFCERKDKVKFATWTSKYGNESNILVDDLPLNCVEWDNEGGKAVLHDYGSMRKTIWNMEVAYGI